VPQQAVEEDAPPPAVPHPAAAVAGVLRRRGPAVPLRRVRGGLGAPARRLPVRLRRSHLDVATRVAGSRLIGGEMRAGFVPEGYDSIGGLIRREVMSLYYVHVFIISMIDWAAICS